MDSSSDGNFVRVQSSPEDCEDEDNPYSQSNLDALLSVLRKTKDSCTSDVDTSHLEEHVVSHYNLRPQKEHQEYPRSIPLYFPQNESDDADGEYIDVKPPRFKTAKGKSRARSNKGMQALRKGDVHVEKGQSSKSAPEGFVTLKVHSKEGHLGLQKIAQEDCLTDSSKHLDKDDSKRSSIASQDSSNGSVTEGTKDCSNDNGLATEIKSLKLSGNCDRCRVLRANCTRDLDQTQSNCDQCMAAGALCSFGILRNRKAATAKVDSPKPREAVSTAIEDVYSSHAALGTSADLQVAQPKNETPGDHVEQHVKTVKTCFAHPVIVDHEPCNFCGGHLFGIFGYGWKEVKMYAVPGSPYWHEVSGGHGGDGKVTSLCKHCTLAKKKIRRCKHRRLTPISRRFWDEQDYDFSDEHLAFLFCQSLEMPHAEVPECNVCLQAGLYVCTEEHRARDYFDDYEGPCGLVLCGDCKSALDEGKNLDQVADTAELEDRTLRADFELLRQDNYLKFYETDMHLPFIDY